MIMNADPLQRYRQLEERLIRARWAHGGRPSVEADRLLQEIDDVWWELDEADHTRLWAEPQRSYLISLKPEFAALVRTAAPPTAASLLTAALLHSQLAPELLAAAPATLTAEQQAYLLGLGISCAQRAVVASAPVEALLGEEVPAAAVELALSIDAEAHRYAMPEETLAGAPLRQALAAAQAQVDGVALELVAAGRLRKEDLSC